MLVRIKENAEKYRDPIGRKMRADAPVLVAGLLHSRGLRQRKRPRALCPVGVINYCLSQGKYGDNLRAVVMHNDEEQPHLHFSYAPIPKLMPKGITLRTQGKKNFIAASRRSKTTITPKSRSTAEWPAWGQSNA